MAIGGCSPHRRCGFAGWRGCQHAAKAAEDEAAVCLGGADHGAKGGVGHLLATAVFAVPSFTLGTSNAGSTAIGPLGTDTLAAASAAGATGSPLRFRSLVGPTSFLRGQRFTFLDKPAVSAPPVGPTRGCARSG